MWSDLVHALAGQLDRVTYFLQCKARVEQSWQEGLPLLEQLIKDRDYTQAEFLLNKMVAGCLRHMAKGDWTPETSLLGCIEYHSDSDRPEWALLRHWLAVAKGLGQTQRAAALRIQIQVLKTPWHWDSVTRGFSQNAGALPKDAVEALFDHWVRYNTQVAVHTGRRDCWLGWLLETGLEPTKTKTWFQSQVNAWLDRLSSDRRALLQDQELLVHLTWDLMHKSPEAARYPALCRMVSRRTSAGQNEKSRREWLNRMDAAESMPRLIQCWQTCVEALVPDPRSGGTYEAQVEWLVVVKELNKQAAEIVVLKWKKDHSRIRNLWAALGKRGLGW